MVSLITLNRVICFTKSAEMSGPLNNLFPGICYATQEVLSCNTFTSRMIIYIVEGTVSDETLSEKIFNAFQAFDGMVLNQEGVVSIDLQMEDIVRVEENNDDGTKVNGKLITGIVVAIVVVLMLFICILLRGGRPQKKWRLLGRDRATSAGYSASISKDTMTDESGACKGEHEDLENERNLKSEESSVKHLASSPARARTDSTASSRDAEAFEEDIRHLTSLLDDAPTVSSEEAIFWANHPPEMEDHECSAATCRTCELRRQQGVVTTTSAATESAINARSPNRSMTGSSTMRNQKEEKSSCTVEPLGSRRKNPAYDDSMRWYQFDDTVEL